MRAEAAYRMLLWAYPAQFRREYGRDMLDLFAAEWDEAREQGSHWRQTALWLRTSMDILTVAPQEHYYMIKRDVQYAVRLLAANPGFTLVAILSLALGIGANTAIFSLWNGVLHSSLPVAEPDRLVMLSNPDAAGVSIGSQTGERTLLTYAEFLHLQQNVRAFTQLAASESNLDRWPARIGNAGPEEVRGRLVSNGFFALLGVAPQLGRTFEAGPEPAPGSAPYAVLSYDFWQRRFGGRPDVLGQPIRIQRAALTVIGVMPPAFFGETTAQRPDLWVPLAMQPAVLPGRDWLHDTGTEKVMWLHALGRLPERVSIAEAQAQTNVAFRQNLETLYGSLLTPDKFKDFVDQRLVIRPAATGASQVRGRFGDPLKVLLAAVALILIIACANLANLLLARGAARQSEIALRLSLGASRGQLIRQLLTESLVLAIAGGLAGLAVAYVFQRGLVLLVMRVDESFQLHFGLDGRLLAFSAAITIGASLLFGLLPALLMTRNNAELGVKPQGRGMTGSAGQVRWGRLLVAAQLALSLPLIIGAGLLAQTLHHLQQADLGYPREGLILARVDVQSAGYEVPRRAPLVAELLAGVRRLPGVRAASFSENGIFSGHDSADEIEVEGYKSTGNRDRGARWDQVGPEYFSTLQIPLRLGRETTERDEASPLKVCVINEAFATQFFAGRNPIGMHITTVYGDRRITHQIVGVAANARTGRLRAKVDPRYYVPITQPLGEFSGVTFEMRVAGEIGPVYAGLRQLLSQRDPNLAMSDAWSVEDRLTSRLAQDWVMARLSLLFGGVALALAAIGLFGVLSYHVARRQGEIGIRMALGAQPGRVVSLILRETTLVILAGLLIGGALAVAAGRALTSQLYGLAPTDPATFVAAGLVLVFVALAAAYLPARRASQLNPVDALRRTV